MRRFRRFALLAFLAAVIAPSAGAGSFFVGVDEDALKWGEGANAGPVLRALGVQAVRITLPWHPGQTQVSAADQQSIDRVVFGTGLRVVVSVYGTATEAPRTEEARTQYCDYVADLLTKEPAVGDVIVWNDPNDGAFWSPQSGADGSSAPADYEALLAVCWTKLHALRATVNVVAASASQPGAVRDAHDTVTWYQKLGEAYRSSGRHEPIFDTVGHVPHAGPSTERPWTKHPRAAAVGEGDYAKLSGALSAAFQGTGQPVPGIGAVSIWYLGQGFQTTIDPAKARLYSGRETDGGLVPAWSAAAAKDKRTGPAPDQATQLADAVRIAYCQPQVSAIFNFHLADEASLTGWQSGVLWADWTPKPSYAAFRRVVSDVNGRRMNCSAISRAGVPPRPAAMPPTVELKISNLHATSVSALAATLSWRTSVAAKATVSYGLAESGPTLWTNGHGTGLTHDASLPGLAFGTSYRVWVSAVSDDGQQADAAITVRSAGAPRAPDSSTAGGMVLLDGQPFFPFVVWSQCPDGYAANLAVGINLFADNPCGGLPAQLDSLRGRAFSAAVAGKDAGGNGSGLIGYFLPDEPDGLGLTPAQMPGRPSGAAGQIGFLTLTNHFYSWAAPLPWSVDYPGFIAKSDVVGFDLYPLQEWCRPERMADVYLSQQELVALAAPRPTFQWIEAAEWRCPGGATAVTPATVRAESWLAIAGGAHGLGYFPATWPAAIGHEIADISRDVAKLGPALVAPSIPADSDKPLVKVGARIYGTAVYVIAVNAGYTPVDATVRVPGLAGRTLSVLDEKRTVSSGDGSFVDSFEPLGVHVYIAAPPS
jgi:hypothetical protein